MRPNKNGRRWKQLEHQMRRTKMVPVLTPELPVADI
jgi:hypothetical protein